MSEITIRYNASTGSNTAASGAGPATAVTGTSAAYSGNGAGGGTQTIITFTNSPDLSAVTTSHILYLNVSAGQTYLFEITAVDNTAKTVTVDTAPTTAINSGSAVSYAIGGKRAGPRRSGTEMDFAMARNGWTFSLDDGSYDITLDAASGTLDCPTDGTLTRVYHVRAASMPVDADNCGVIFTFDLSTMDGSGESFNFQGHWYFFGIEWKPNATAGSTSAPFSYDAIHAYRCKYNGTSLTSSTWRPYATSWGGRALFLECVFDGKIDNLGEIFHLTLIHCSCRDADPFSTATSNYTHICIGCTFEDCDEVKHRIMGASNSVIYGCTFFKSKTGNSHLGYDYSGPFNLSVQAVLNCAIIDAATYGIAMDADPMGDGVDPWMIFPPEFRDYNHFDGNTSGNYNPTTSATTNQGSGDPGFVSETGTIDLRPNTGSALLDAGKNPDIVGDT